ncbi:MAG: AAA family ATPase, partial [Opitutales bacterium]|nr:AAA family ATPase [Opitutales bacterium]
MERTSPTSGERENRVQKQLIFRRIQVLRVLADRPDASAQFLILGSASPELSRKASESLTGRVETIEMGGFSLGEVGGERLDRLWIGVKRPYLDEYGCGLAD